MSEDRLFDPVEYGATATTPRRRVPRADCRAVEVVAPWIVLRHLKAAPTAHVVFIDAPVVLDKSVRLAACGAYGLPMRDLDGTSAPACARCAEKLAKAKP